MADLYLYSSGAGDLTGFTPSSGANWQCVQTNNGDTQYVANPSGIHDMLKDLYNFDNIAGRITDEATINSLTLKIVAREETTPSRELFPVIKEGGQETEGAAYNLTTSYVTYNKTWTTNPRTGGAWTKAQIDSLQGGQRTYPRRSGCSNDTVIRRITYVALVVAYTEPARTAEQKHFRIYQDDAGLNAATSLAAQDTDLASWQTGEVFRVRFSVASTAAGSVTISRRLEYREGGGTWLQAAAGAGAVRLYLSGNFADGDATTNRLSLTNAFTAGQGKASGSQTGSLALAGGHCVEDEFCLRAEAEAAGKSYEFRISNAGVGLDAYAQIPEIFFVSPPPPPAPPAIDPSLILVGAREISVDGVPVGALEGGVQILRESLKLLHEVDQLPGAIGADKIDEILRCKFTIKEATLENLRIAMAQPTYQLSAAGDKSTLNVGGQRALPNPHTVQIQGKAPGTDMTRTIYFNKCMVEEGGVHIYRKEGATLYEVTLICLAEASLPEGYQVGYFEDDSGAFTFA